MLADTGIIYSGRKDRISELAWVFGQHERNVLQIVCFALRELADLDVRGMADPVLVSRAISSIINGHVSLFFLLSFMFFIRGSSFVLFLATEDF